VITENILKGRLIEKTAHATSQQRRGRYGYLWSKSNSNSMHKVNSISYKKILAKANLGSTADHASLKLLKHVLLWLRMNMTIKRYSEEQRGIHPPPIKQTNLCASHLAPLFSVSLDF